MILLQLQQNPNGWANVPTKQPNGFFEALMMADGKIYVVLAVVLIIWFCVLFFLFRTDRKLSQLEGMMRDNERTS
jgi:CcmD family protein